MARSVRYTGMALSLVTASMFFFGCGMGGGAAPTGTLPPIKTTTTIAASQTTFQPYFLHYRLRSGETLAVVAKAYNIPVEVLIEFNKDRLGDNPNRVGVGTEIVIPPQRFIDTMTTPPTTEPGTSEPSTSQ